MTVFPNEGFIISAGSKNQMNIIDVNGDDDNFRLVKSHTWSDEIDYISFGATNQGVFVSYFNFKNPRKYSILSLR